MERAVAYAIQIMTRLQGTMSPFKQVTVRRMILLIQPSDLHLLPDSPWRDRLATSDELFPSGACGMGV